MFCGYYTGPVTTPSERVTMQCEEPIRGNFIKIYSGGDENSPSILSILEVSYGDIDRIGGKGSYIKTCIKRTLSNRPKIGFQDQLSLNAGQKYCRMLQGEHSAIRLTFIKLPFVIKIFVLSVFE